MRTFLLASAALLLATSADAADLQKYCSTDRYGKVSTLTMMEDGYLLHTPGEPDYYPGDSLKGVRVQVWGEGDEPDDPVDGMLVGASQLFLPCS